MALARPNASTSRPRPAHGRSGVKASIVADGDEIADCGLADVGAPLDHLLRRRPILVTDLASAEDMAAAPAALHVFGAREELRRLAALGVDAAHLRGVGRDIAAAAPLRVAQHDE